MKNKPQRRVSVNFLFVNEIYFMHVCSSAYRSAVASTAVCTLYIEHLLRLSTLCLFLHLNLPLRLSSCISPSFIQFQMKHCCCGVRICEGINVDPQFRLSFCSHPHSPYLQPSNIHRIYSWSLEIDGQIAHAFPRINVGCCFVS